MPSLRHGRFAIAAAILASEYVTAVTAVKRGLEKTLFARNVLESKKPLGRRFLEDYDGSFLADYSLKFEGCNSITGWNGGAGQGDDGEDDGAKVVSKRLALLRLCPKEDCDDGCSEAYGEYVVSLGNFIQIELWAQQQEGADENDGGDFDPADYSHCAAFGDYYVGPECTDEGGVAFAVFTDASCSMSSDVDISELTGYSFETADGSLVSGECMSCEYEQEGEQQEEGDNIEANAMCKEMYEMAGKCETLMDVDYPNENGCDYIAELQAQAAEANESAGPSKELTTFVIVSGVLVLLLGAYVCYLKKKIKRASIDLTGEKGSTELL